MEEKILLSDEELEKVTGGLNDIDTNYYPIQNGNKQVNVIGSSNDSNDNSKNKLGVSSIAPGDGNNVTSLTLDSWDEDLSIGK